MNAPKRITFWMLFFYLIITLNCIHYTIYVRPEFGKQQHLWIVAKLKKILINKNFDRTIDSSHLFFDNKPSIGLTWIWRHRSVDDFKLERIHLWNSDYIPLFEKETINNANEILKCVFGILQHISLCEQPGYTFQSLISC